MAYNVWMCSLSQHGVLCPGRLCWDWLVSVSQFRRWCLFSRNAPRLISASVGTVVYYGYQCHPGKGQTFLWLCFLTGLAGNIFPFMEWFNERKYRVSIYGCESLINANFVQVLSNRILFSNGLFVHCPHGKLITIAYCRRSRFIYL